MDVAKAIRDKGWKKGAVLPAKEAEKLDLQPTLDLGEHALLVVLTQDCDLVHSDFETEPFVEFLLAEPAEEPDGLLPYGRNPRRIQFYVGDDLYEASCHARARTARTALAQLLPSNIYELSQATVELLGDWIAKRYTRPAFPDELNRRIDARRSKIRDILKKHGSPIAKIYISCTPYDELPKSASYKIAVWLVMTLADYENLDLRQACEKVVLRVERQLTACSGIEIVECSLRHEGEISLDDLRYLAPWDFDYLTHREASKDR